MLEEPDWPRGGRCSRKDLGFALEQIARLLDDNLTPAQTQEILAMKQAELRARVREEQERLARVTARLRLISEEGAMPEHEVRIRQVQAQLVASVRDVVPPYPEIGPLFGEVAGYLAQHGPAMPGDQNDDGCVTEIQFPVTSKGL